MNSSCKSQVDFWGLSITVALCLDQQFLLGLPLNQRCYLVGEMAWSAAILLTNLLWLNDSTSMSSSGIYIEADSATRSAAPSRICLPGALTLSFGRMLL